MRLSGEQVVEQIRDQRNELIQKITRKKELLNYLKQRSQKQKFSEVKLKFIVKALTELNSSPLDLEHYSALILDSRKKGELIISSHNESFFYRDIERTIASYL